MYVKISNVRHYVLRDFKGKMASDFTGSQAEREADQFHNYVAFVCLLNHPREDRMYCGLTAMDSNVLARFNTRTKQFEPLDYRPVAEPFEVKVHRSLCLAADGTVYGATSCLYSLDKRLEAPGGAIFRIKPGDSTPVKLVVPVPHDYIQTITLDDKRGLIYGQTYPVFKFFVYNINTGEVQNFDYVGSISHVSALDDSGCFWSTWDSNNHFLYKYDPATRKITYFKHGLPNARAEANMMYPGAGPVDCMINGGDGYLYVGTTGGSLCRIDPRTAEVAYLGKPAPTTRMPGLVVWRDGLLLGCCGDNEGSCVFAYDREKKSFHQMGQIRDSVDNLLMFRVHDICLAGHQTVYVAETDAPNRSSYLWECRLEA